MVEESLQQEKARLAEIRKAQAADDFRHLMHERWGRRLVYGWLSDARVFNTTFNPASQNPGVDMAFAEGRKQAGYKLLERALRTTPEEYALMMKENQHA